MGISYCDKALEQVSENPVVDTSNGGKNQRMIVHDMIHHALYLSSLETCAFTKSCGV